jgi:drug/metabolite transporter (DMT)-like permease
VGRRRALSGPGAPAATGTSLLAIAIAFWSTSFWGTEIAARHTSAAMLSGIRCMLALVLLAALLPVLRARLPGGRMWAWTVITGLLMVTLFFIGLAEGVARAGAANASILSNTTPLIVMVIGWLFLRERLSRVGVLGLLAGFAGVVVMVAPQVGGDGETGDLPLGLVFALLGALGWGVGTLIVKWLAERDPGIDFVGLTAGQYLIGAPVLLAIGFGVSGTDGTAWESGDLWGSLVYLAIGPSVLATLAFFVALRYVSATTASSWLFLAPVGAVLIEIARGNVPEAIVGVGMALAILGVALVNVAPWLESRRAPAPAPNSGSASV